MKVGNKVTIISGSRLRRLSDDGKTFLDQGLNDGALIDNDKEATVVGVVDSKDKAKTAFVVDVSHNGATLRGWIYTFETTLGRP